MSEIATVPGEQAKWKQAHALALSIYQTQQRANSARARGDELQAGRELAVVKNLRQLLANKFEEIRELVGDELTWGDEMILGVDAWVSAFLKALPGAIAAIPLAVLDGLRKLLARAGGMAIEAVFPWAILAVGIVGVLIFAEKSKIVRRLV